MPLGRILNRFTADFTQVDSIQAYNFAFCLYNFMVVLGIIVAAVFVSPIIILFAIVLLSICTWYGAYYLLAARQMKRLESTAKSPVFELFSTALAGIGTIRAFDKQVSSSIRTPADCNELFSKRDQTPCYMYLHMCTAGQCVL
jgi:ABC-type multidrug transport system fused ATPase/permease subunit